MRITKGDKTVEDYFFKGGVEGRFFSYGLVGENGPAVYKIERIDVGPIDGLVAVLKTERIDHKKEGKKETLNLAIHRDDYEVSID